ncbi:P-loop ATPase, Sll1717 family [Pseudomonas sp.]|uniref:P-loop ATPase, Sll1717 family n=1 Tax=Pseudomonas sp. TaxID=306 RepID=UPI00299DF20C|nr:hypothetical protein [Pseudomonas sp.]MDX1367100.1 hypothetical protein [Pseudomonas sp.]
MWKRVNELKDPFNDAVNYRSRGEKEFFSKLFLRTDELTKIISPPIYYIMGEKGSGKTAYATYLENTMLEKNHGKVITLTETQYKRFIALKVNGKLNYSDYANIWRSILLSITSQIIIEKSKTFLNSIGGKFKVVEDALKKWNKSSLNPEIDSAIEALNSFTARGKAGYELIEIEGERKKETTRHTEEIKHHLFDNETTLKEAINSISLSHNHIIFIDGIDFRPSAITYKEYLECIKGLGEAAWQLNTEFFNTIRDSKGRIKIVLLVRPDVFHSLNLYNSNSRIQDNSVYLNWHTTEHEAKNSPLFEVVSKYLSSQQLTESAPLDAWCHYFADQPASIATFKKFLRSSFQKPRDILTFIKILRALHLRKGLGASANFNRDLLKDPSFTTDLSDYLLGEVRNYAAFYMTPEDFGHHLKFFQFLDGKSCLTFSEFTESFDQFSVWSKGEKIHNRAFLRDADSLLQFFYDVNIIGYREKSDADEENFYHWSYRERSLNNTAPKVKSVENLMINPGIAKALDIGKRFKETNHKQQAARSQHYKRKPKVGSKQER